MTKPRSGALPLLAVVLVGAAAAAALVVFGTSSGPALRIGSPAPDFELPVLSGDDLALGELRGRVLFVNFWATWCPPCREEAPAMQRLYQQLANEPFEMLAISIDQRGTDAEIEAFRQEFGLGFPLLLDPDKTAYGAYQVYGVPETFLIDAEGRLAERFIGPKKWDDPRYERAIRRLMAASADRHRTSSVAHSDRHRTSSVAHSDRHRTSSVAHSDRHRTSSVAQPPGEARDG